MIVLVANLGSTSFKFKLYETSSEGAAVLASGHADRIGQGGSAWKVVGPTGERGGAADFTDHQAAIAGALEALPRTGFGKASRIEAVGFKAVHGGPIRGAVRVDESVIATMEEFADVAPAHNPPYIAAMRALAELLPDVPQVAAFETAFHQTIPLARQVYGTPYEWVEKGIRRYGFHGASHSYIAERIAEVQPDAQRVISLHLGGSCSVCAIQDGKSVAHSMGTTPQTGLFHANRVGDFDIFALLKLREQGLGTDDVFRQLGSNGGLLGLSGVSADMRDIRAAAEGGNDRARLALDAFTECCRHYLGAYSVVLGGVDAVVFTAGIGQHDCRLRADVCRGLEFLGVQLDERRNADANGQEAAALHADGGDASVWVIPTDEEQVVARQTVAVLAGAVTTTT